jgi:ABC-type amino acid transport substrate-binding protein
VPPWTFAEEPASFRGIMSEVIFELGRLSGLPVSVELMPFARLLVLIESGRAALTVAIRTPLLEKVAMPLARLGTEDIVIATLKGLPVQSMQDLRGKQVAQLRYIDYLADSDPDPSTTKYEINSYEQGVKMLLEGRFDAVIGLRTSLTYALGQNPAAAGRIAPIYTVRSKELCVWLSRAFRDREAMQRLQAGAKQLVDQRVIERVRRDFMKAGAGPAPAARA